ncbi:MAG: LPS assembly lipoprotein LptE [Chitinophagales bacterium]|nr:LPS assembly lipoprotein LptE [Chitinophagales bacterium]
MRIFLPLIIIALSLSGCHYSFKSASVDASITSYYVEQFTNNALNAPATLNVRLTEDLKEKIRTESRLVYNDTDPDVEFSGILVSYRVTAEAPQPGEVTSINRLTITTAVEYTNNRDDEKNWKRNFSFFYDFSTSVDLSQVEEEAITEISQQMMEDIFNAAFNDW